MLNKSHLDKPITAEDVDSVGAVMETDFNAQTVLAATLDDTPVALTVGEDRLVGRQAGGNVSGLTAAQVRTIVELDGSLSPMVLSGGAISAGTDAGKFKVGELTALLRVAHEEIGVLDYVTKAEEDNIEIANPNTTYVVALNYSGGNPTISISESLPNLTQNIPIGKVMKDGSDVVHFISGGYRLYNGFARLHMRAQSLRALELMSGSAIAYAGVNNFAMTAGVVYGGINKFDMAQYSSASTTFTPVYGDGGSGFTEGAARNTLDFEHYDDGSGVLEAVGVGRYGCHWVYRHAYDGHVYVVYGLDSYKLAEAAVADEPTKPDHLTDFGLLIGKIIAPQAGGSFTAVYMVTDTVFTGVSVATHNNLGGLNDGDYKHLTATEKTLFDTVESGADITDAVNIASSIHGVSGKTTPVNADEVGLVDSAAANVLKKLTWANIKATLKTYFDTLYSLYSHPNHTGAVTSTGDGATAITDKAVTLAKMADMATTSLLGRNTAATGVPEVLSKATAQSLLNIEDGATADQTGAEIKALYEAEANAFTDTKNTKLTGIETGARVGILDADAIKWAIVFGG